MKYALTAASLVLVAASAVGCGSKSSSDSGSDAVSEKAFCANLEQVAKDTSSLSSSTDPKEIVKTLKAAGKSIEDTGTPSSISSDARKGYEIEVKAIADLPDDATQKDIMAMQSDLSSTEQAQVKAFNDYVGTTCASSSSSSPSPSPSQ
ncbi:MAG: hypothetical protein ACXVW4_15455 [Nocardioides sp.]